MNNGVGTLSERTLHAMLKRQYEPNPACHEIPCGPFIADILREDEIIEVQTRSFDRMEKKIRFFLEASYRVRVVFPIARVKWIIWVDPQTGVCTNRRRSPKEGTAHEVLRELWKLAPFLKHPAFSLDLVFLEVEDYRNQNGWGKQGKRGSVRMERIPKQFFETLHLQTFSDYVALLPQDLPTPFTTADYARLRRCTARSAGQAVYTLWKIGLLQRTGKQKNAYLYAPDPSLLS